MDKYKLDGEWIDVDELPELDLDELMKDPEVVEAIAEDERFLTDLMLGVRDERD